MIHKRYNLEAYIKDINSSSTIWAENLTISFRCERLQDANIFNKSNLDSLHFDIEIDHPNYYWADLETNHSISQAYSLHPNDESEVSLSFGNNHLNYHKFEIYENTDALDLLIWAMIDETVDLISCHFSGTYTHYDYTNMKSNSADALFVLTLTAV